jgi:hypothetical protein
MIPRAVDTCSACKGHVVEEVVEQVVAQQVTIYYCADCGIAYRLPPSRMKKMRKARPIEFPSG